jgi:hypothetical protein
MNDLRPKGDSLDPIHKEIIGLGNKILTDVPSTSTLIDPTNPDSLALLDFRKLWAIDDQFPTHDAELIREHMTSGHLPEKEPRSLGLLRDVRSLAKDALTFLVTDRLRAHQEQVQAAQSELDLSPGFTLTSRSKTIERIKNALGRSFSVEVEQLQVDGTLGLKDQNGDVRIFEFDDRNILTGLTLTRTGDEHTCAQLWCNSHIGGMSSRTYGDHELMPGVFDYTASEGIAAYRNILAEILHQDRDS